MLYNVPSRTGCDLLPETVADLAGHPNIVGIKEACASRERVQALLALRRPGFAVFSGDDSSAARSMLDGADGLVSVASTYCRPLIVIYVILLGRVSVVLSICGMRVCLIFTHFVVSTPIRFQLRHCYSVSALVMDCVCHCYPCRYAIMTLPITWLTKWRHWKHFLAVK